MSPSQKHFAAAALLLSLVIAAGAADAAENGLNGLTRGAAATVAGIVDGDTLVLGKTIDGASEVRLVGIQAPKLPLGRRNFKKWPLADAAKALLGKLTLGKQVRLSYGGQRLDRYGRLLAHLHLADGGSWIQGELLAAGMARVYSFPDNRAVVADMLQIEKKARSDKRGIWAHGYYRVRTAATAARYSNSFQLIEGRVLDAVSVRGRIYLNFGANWRDDFTISLTPGTVRLFRQGGVDPLNYKGKRIRVRGWLKSFNGPMINASHPEQIEMLE
ncbi:MAG: thermonuclease family protein [Rhodospirillales bacterium]|nr:thermonuclease family protein [Rhodospirillales bacterium]